MKKIKTKLNSTLILIKISIYTYVKISSIIINIFAIKINDLLIFI